jgi:hypothetical protein
VGGRGNTYNFGSEFLIETTGLEELGVNCGYFTETSLKTGPGLKKNYL